jgi:YfiR/HmsC-like
MSNMIFRLVTVIFLGTSLAAQVRSQEIDEYQVKAAFLYNFAKFVEWPPDAFRTPRDPVTICVLGHSPFGSALDEVIHGKSIDGRSLSYRQVPDAASTGICQILFVPSSENKHFRSICGNLRPFGILTVGETQGFTAIGGVINFKLDGGHVRFTINVDAAERAQLHISSKLLSLAQIVKTEASR